MTARFRNTLCFIWTGVRDLAHLEKLLGVGGNVVGISHLIQVVYLVPLDLALKVIETFL